MSDEIKRNPINKDISQFVPAPTGLYAKCPHSADTGLTDIEENECGGRIISSIYDFDGTYDYLPVVCFGVVEKDDGKCLHPMVYMPEPYVNGYDIRDITKERDYDELVFDDGKFGAPSTIKITSKDKYNTVLLDFMKPVVSIVVESAASYAMVMVYIEGKDVCLGSYNDLLTAKVVKNDLAESIENKLDYEMPDDSEAYCMKRNHQYREACTSGSEMLKTFGGKCGLFDDLIRAECYTLDDVKNLTREKLMSTKGIKEKRCKQIVEELNKRGYFPK